MRDREVPMAGAPKQVVEFLSGKRIAVAGVSRDSGQAANAVYRKLKTAGYEVFAVNPNATELEGSMCYPDLAALPEPVDGVVIATHPDVAVSVVRQCVEHGIRRLWFHRSFGDGSVSEAAIRECVAGGIDPIVGGCPLMYCEPIDLGHRCMRWWLHWQRRVPR
jgi:predicted CoA-binding protein